MKKNLLLVGIVAIGLFSCGGGGEQTPMDPPSHDPAVKEAVAIDPMEDMGIGPIASLELGEVNPELAAQGQEVFESKCTACHKVGKRFVGPDVAGVTKRRSPEWIMNMILNPEEMVQKNEQAKQLLMEYSAPMANQNLTEEEARATLEYFRTL